MHAFTAMLKQSGLSFNQHQYDGVEFCLKNEKTRQLDVYGGIIADEMGLGKTITAIGTMVANPLPNTLIVLPPVLLVQWQKAINKTMGFNALLYHGQQKKQIKNKELMASPVVLTTYNAIRTGKKSNLLLEVKWDRVIFDEAHHLRNKNLAHKGAIELKTKIRWLITGTPIQNNISDYYNLCAVLGLNRAIYCDKTMTGRILETFVLKRTKRLVPEIASSLPEVMTHTVQVDWNTDYPFGEYQFAEDIHGALSFCGVAKGPGAYAKKLVGGNLVNMLRARQACTLPSLLQTDLKKKRIKYNVGADSKIQAVVRTIVDNQDNGAGKLVFCHYRGEIDAISRRLNELNIKSSIFDGRTSLPERQAILMDKTNLVILLQIQTGCEGLNLQENYSEVYFVSPHWNPSVEAQAIGRCHRMGQQKKVHVYRFVMNGFEQGTSSLDMYIRSVQDKKMGVSNRIMQGKDDEIVV